MKQEAKNKLRYHRFVIGDQFVNDNKLYKITNVDNTSPIPIYELKDNNNNTYEATLPDDERQATLIGTSVYSEEFEFLTHGNPNVLPNAVRDRLNISNTPLIDAFLDRLLLTRKENNSRIKDTNKYKDDLLPKNFTKEGLNAPHSWDKSGVLDGKLVLESEDSSGNQEVTLNGELWDNPARNLVKYVSVPFHDFVEQLLTLDEAEARNFKGADNSGTYNSNMTTLRDATTGNIQTIKEFKKLVPSALREYFKFNETNKEIEQTKSGVHNLKSKIINRSQLKQEMINALDDVFEFLNTRKQQKIVCNMTMQQMQKYSSEDLLKKNRNILPQLIKYYKCMVELNGYFDKPNGKYKPSDVLPANKIYTIRHVILEKVLPILINLVENNKRLISELKKLKDDLNAAATTTINSTLETALRLEFKQHIHPAKFQDFLTTMEIMEFIDKLQTKTLTYQNDGTYTPSSASSSTTTTAARTAARTAATTTTTAATTSAQQQNINRAARVQQQNSARAARAARRSSQAPTTATPTTTTTTAAATTPTTTQQQSSPVSTLINTVWYDEEEDDSYVVVNQDPNLNTVTLMEWVDVFSKDYPKVDDRTLSEDKLKNEYKKITTWTDSKYKTNMGVPMLPPIPLQDINKLLNQISDNYRKTNIFKQELKEATKPNMTDEDIKLEAEIIAYEFMRDNALQIKDLGDWKPFRTVLENVGKDAIINGNYLAVSLKKRGSGMLFTVTGISDDLQKFGGNGVDNEGIYSGRNKRVDEYLLKLMVPETTGILPANIVLDNYVTLSKDEFSKLEIDDNEDDVLLTKPSFQLYPEKSGFKKRLYKY